MEGGGVEFQQPYEVSEPASWLRPAGGEESITRTCQNQIGLLVRHASSDHSRSLKCLAR